MDSRAILSNFFEEQRTQNHPQSRPFGIVARTFFDNLSRNNCIPNYKNVVIEKWKKGKSQIGINLGGKPNEFIASVPTWTSYLKENKTENSSGEM